MKHINARILILPFVLLLASMAQQAMAQCTNPSINLPDQSQPVNNPAVSYCTEFTIEPSVTGDPLGLSMNITHTWQGDLSIRITACGNTLMVMTRPGGGQCGGGCPCGSDADMGGVYTFADGGGPNPDLGVSTTGGAYGVSTDPCGAGTVSSFAELLAGCAGMGTYSFTVCITDHAGADVGIATNVTPIFANPPVCGCTDPAASNYNPAANVDDGTCMYCNFSANATVTQPTCGQNNGAISVTPTGAGFTYAWSPAITNNSSVSNLAPGTYTITVTQGGCTSITTATLNPSSPVSVTATPTNATCGLANGSISVSPTGPGYTYSWSPPTVNGANPTNLSPGAYTVTVTAPGGCTGTATVIVNTTPPSVPMITGPLSFCQGSATILNAGSGYQSYAWSNGDVTQQTVIFAPGVYSVTVVNADGCVGMASVTVVQTPPPVPPINGNLTYCDGAFTTLSVPAGFTNISWSNGSTGPSTTVSAPGTYTVTVTQNGCTGTNSVTVTEIPTPQPTISGATAICAGSSTTLMVNGTYSSYAWSGGGGNGPSRVVSNPGTYTVTVTQNGCTGTASVTVTVAQNPMPTITGALSFCPGDGTILNAGNGYSSYVWSNGGSTSAALSVGTPGTYSVTVTNAAGCTGTASVTVTQSSVPTPAINGNTSICAGQSTTLTTGSFSSYAWSPSGTGQSINVNTPGTYTVTVTNAAGCTGSASVTVNQPASPTPTIVGNNSICVGESTTLNAGSGFSSYLWSPGGSTAQQITVSAGGTYNVTVTNAAGCPGTATFNVSQASSLTPVISGVLTVCPGDQTALSVVGTYATYSWSTGSNNPSINVGTANTYSVTVTSAGGCVGSTSVNVAQSPTPTPSITGDLDYCAGLSTQLNAGAGHTSYLWSSGSTGQFDTISTPGSQSVTVTNSLGCEGTATAIVVQNPNPTPNITGLTAICPTNGSTVLQVSGGPYTNYQWSTGQSSASVTANAVGSIAVTVTNSNGCIGNTQAQISLLTAPTPTISGPAAICEGTNGTLTASGGFTNYSWSTGSAIQNTSVSAAGNYDVTVTDSNGCTGSTSFSVTENQLPVVSIAGDLDFCAGESSQLDAGAGFTNYQWSNSQTGQFNTVASNGNFSVTVTDAAGCQNSATALVTEYNLPQAQIAGSLSFCINGSTTLSAGGGTFAAYLWSNGSTMPSISTGQPGNYALMITDANGCSNSDTVAVQELTELTPSVTGDLAFCDGETTLLDAGTGYNTYLWSNGSDASQLTVSSTGTYSVTVSNADGCMGQTSVTVVENLLPVVSINGAANFCAGSTSTLSATPGFETYQWTGGTDTETIAVTSGGTYQLTVTDANGCQNATSFAIQEIPLPTPSISGVPAFCPGAAATLTANAGYQNYLWDNGLTAATISASTTDNFSVTVTDAFGCTGSTSIDVAEYVTTTPVISGVLDFCQGDGTSLNASGNFVNYVWTGGVQSQVLAVSQPGAYSVTATDPNGCLTNASVTVIQNPLPQFSILGDLDFCDGLGSTLSVSNPYPTYLWSNQSGAASLPVNSSGNYSVTVTDANGCQNSNTVAVVEYPLPQVAITGTLFFCEGSSTTLNAPSGLATYVWNNNPGAANLTVTTPGQYTVIGTDANGCSATASASVLEADVPVAVINPVSELDCATREVTLSSNGSSQGAGFQYVWSGPDIQASEINSPNPVAGIAGGYTLTVSDLVYNCPTATASINVIDLAYEPAASLLVTDVLDCNTASVQLNGAGSESGPGIVYRWYNAAGNLLSSSGAQNYYQVGQAGGYTLEVFDQLTSCVSTVSATVSSDFNYPVANAGPPRHLDCRNTLDALDATGSSQGTQFSYAWSTGLGNIVQGPTTATPSVNAPGAYNLVVTNNQNGCTANASVQVTQNIQQPNANAGQDQTLNCVISLVTLDASVSVASQPLYRWVAAGTADTVAITPTLDLNAPGNYVLWVIDNLNGCADSDVANALLDDAFVQDFSVITDQPTCFNDTDGSIVVHSVEGGTPPFVYSLNGAAFRPGGVFNNLGSGEYNILIQDALGCEYQEDAYIEVSNDLRVDAGPDRFIDWGDSVRIQAQINVPSDEITSMKWQSPGELPCANCPELVLGPLETTAYSISVSDENGCVAKDQVTVFVRRNRDVFIPNAFSPDNDGTNDVLMIFAGDEVVRIKSFQVFNRWGESVFEVYTFLPNDPIYGWNGAGRGGQVFNAAVFVYLAEVEFIDGSTKLYTGDVSLIR
ncbi:MAG: gliding motility-associated C-terminal domain-containing protein [Saprospiraceae bacterium]